MANNVDNKVIAPVVIEEKGPFIVYDDFDETFVNDGNPIDTMKEVREELADYVQGMSDAEDHTFTIYRYCGDANIETKITVEITPTR